MYSFIHIVVVCFLAVQFAYISTNPIPESTIKPDGSDDFFDQRQNGSENVRIHMNDVMLVMAPSEGILQLMSASANEFLNANNDISNSNKPPGSSAYSSDCATDNAAKCKQQPHKK